MMGAGTTIQSVLLLCYKQQMIPDSVELLLEARIYDGTRDKPS